MVILSVVMMVVGLAVLIFGADIMIRGVTALATRLGVPPIVIGMTVVAFGTSMPEVAVNLISAFRHETGLAFGNVVGSCSINIGWVLALTAIIRPLKVDAIIIRREIPFMILAVIVFLVMTLDPQLNGSGLIPQIGRTDGIILLLFFCVFLYYTVFQTKAVQSRDGLVAEVAEVVADVTPMPKGKMAGMIVLGLLCVAVGAQLAVSGAVTIARRLDVPENIIGLTLVSFGTTLPELVTCIIAARRGQSEIAMGNVVGSNILNILFVGGAVATVHPIAVPQGGVGDVSFLAIISVLTLPIAMRATRTVTRAEGAFLLLIYFSYMTYRTVSIVAK